MSKPDASLSLYLIRHHESHPHRLAGRAAFLASWFLPVLEDVPGWMAFRYALAPLVPFRDAGATALGRHVPQVLSALTNVVFVILFALWLVEADVPPGPVRAHRDRLLRCSTSTGS